MELGNYGIPSHFDKHWGVQTRDTYSEPVINSMNYQDCTIKFGLPARFFSVSIGKERVKKILRRK